jgi:hypothetical protein
MAESTNKLLLVIPIREQEDLLPVAKAQEWATVKDLFKKTSTSYNTHWNGKYVVDLDEIPWKATKEELDSLEKSHGKVIVLSEGNYHVSEKLNLYNDTDGSVYVLEKDVEQLFD